MNDSLIELNILRNNFEFASIAQFFHTFQSAFRPWPVRNYDYSRNTGSNEYEFETEDLEIMILDVSQRPRFEDLIVRMLRLASHNRFINSSNWQLYFSKEFEKRQTDKVNPFIDPNEQEDPEVKKELVNYFTLPLDTRVHLLYLLCDWQLDEPDKFREHLESEEDAVQWRVDPIGFDKKGSTFWLFDDNRLYKETPKPTKKSNKRKKKFIGSRRSSRRTTKTANPKGENEEESEEESEEEGEWVPWKLICASKQEWEQIPTKYKNSKNPDEQKFYELLTEDVLPKVLPVLEEHEKELLRIQALMQRKRSSRIMIRELEALERKSVEPVAEPVESTNKGRTSHRIEKKTLEDEEKRKEMITKAREQRALEREQRILEREQRMMAREKRQGSFETGEDGSQLNESKDVLKETAPQSNGINPLTSENKLQKGQAKKITLKVKKEEVENKPKRKYVKKPKFDENGNPIPRKVKLDADGNPIPLKKRGRKPKNKDQNEDHWVFDCICGISGENLDDGTPMIACEKCGIWQHIACLQKSGTVENNKSLENFVFICQKCDKETIKEVQSTEALVDTTQNKEVLTYTSTLSWQPQHQASSVRESLQPNIPPTNISESTIETNVSNTKQVPNSFPLSQQSDLRHSVIHNSTLQPLNFEKHSDGNGGSDQSTLLKSSSIQGATVQVSTQPHIKASSIIEPSTQSTEIQDSIVPSSTQPTKTQDNLAPSSIQPTESQDSSTPSSVQPTEIQDSTAPLLLQSTLGKPDHYQKSQANASSIPQILNTIETTSPVDMEVVSSYHTNQVQKLD